MAGMLFMALPKNAEAAEVRDLVAISAVLWALAKVRFPNVFFAAVAAD